ncbi:MAG TPA: FUSC family protein [Bryobacteraceae bacterium]|nr:FUSC family protein [Bryobacteraceae bacterium]
MATLAQTVPESQRPSYWFREFLKEELAPYPGRAALVARMMIAATLAMLLSMTFRMPEGAYGAIYALTISRESPRATVSAVKTLAIAFVVAAVYELIGAMFFVDEPLLRVVWVIATFFLMFYCLSALTNYTAGVRFGYLVVITTPLWDRHISAEARVEGTLWAVWTITVASIVTALVELVYAEWSRRDDVIGPIAERLNCVEELVSSYAEDKPINETTAKKVTRLAMVGMSQARRNLQRSSYTPHHREQMGAVVALVARLVDIAATSVSLNIKVSDIERERMRSLAKTIAVIRADLEGGVAPRGTQSPEENDEPGSVPLLREMQATVSLIPKVFAGPQSLSAYAPLSSGDVPGTGLFRPDARSNFNHIKFALKGGLAASLCYIIYNLSGWPGISTAITTCLLTALSTIGSSHQKQVLRIAGAIVGGVVLGIGSQVFILPHLDSIADFTILFLAVTLIAAWFATCSPRLSYFGIQIAVAFYLINLQEFKIQISLGVARDRVVGILLGLLMMWFIFDRLWGAPAGVEMKKAFVSSLRLLAQLAREPISKDVGVAIKETLALRETINAQFDRVRALADGVLFEFGASRQPDLAMRDRIRQWQPQLRTLFLMRVASLKYRLHLPGFELPEAVRAYQREYDQRSAQMLEEMADAIQGTRTDVRLTAEEDFAGLLERLLGERRGSDSQRSPATRGELFVTLLRQIDQLTTSLAKEVAANGSV